MLTSCLECGELSNQAHCTEHRPQEPPKHKPNNDQDYDWNWKKLSRRARKLQPFCSDCGTTQDLQADHSPEAWQRKTQGKTIRLQDISVVCGKCNRNRGPARGKKSRNKIKQNNFTPGALGSNNSFPTPGPQSEFQILSVSGNCSEVV